MSEDEKIDLLVERARAEMMAHHVFRDEQGNPISREEAMRQADEVLGPEQDARIEVGTIYRHAYANGAAEDRAVVLEILDKHMEAAQTADDELDHKERRSSKSAEALVDLVKRVPLIVRDPNDVRVDTVVVVERTVLAEMLEQIEATGITWERDGYWVCRQCGASARRSDDKMEHTKTCRYVRVRDALNGLGL